MAKIIKYAFLSCRINHGTEETPEFEDVLLDKQIQCNSDKLEANLEIAKKEAYNGEYTVEDDGQSDPEAPETNNVTWDELDAAYREGVDSV